MVYKKNHKIYAYGMNGFIIAFIAASTVEFNYWLKKEGASNNQWLFALYTFLFSFSLSILTFLFLALIFNSGPLSKRFDKPVTLSP